MSEPDEPETGQALERLRAEYAALPVTADVDLDDVADGARRTRRRRRSSAAAAAAAVVVVAGGAAVWVGTHGSNDDAQRTPSSAAW